MLVIGVTGNIGSGKSLVCRTMARLGAATIDADKVAHQAYKPHSQTWEDLVDTFSKDILKPGEEEIDRRKLAEIAFSQPEVLASLNSIVHPEAFRLTKQEIEDCRYRQVKVVALEASLLIEANWLELVNKVWLVVASRDIVLQRLTRDRHIDESQFFIRLNSQMPPEEKMPYADEVIYNDGSLAQLEVKITGLWRKSCGQMS
ncbi:MAG: dephospho-CoA kinase [Dehalococcoidia bacterium]|nr:dephospho-CoA kinase [Dehalococcoidia bacterium]